MINLTNHTQDGISSPNPNYEQPVKCVTGNNTVRVRGKNWFDKDNITDNAGYTGNVNDTLSTNTNTSTFIAPLITSNNGNITISSNKTSAIYRIRLIDSNNKILSSTAYTTMPQTIDTRNCDKIAIMFDKTTITIADNIQIEQGSTATDYEPYYEPQEKPLNLRYLEIYENGYFSKENGKWYLNNEWGKIASYNGETITTDYYSTTGQLTTGATVVYKLSTPSKTEITDPTLINQLNDIYKLMSYDGTTIIETECETGNLPILIKASALLDSAKVIEDLETRIEVLESEE